MAIRSRLKDPDVQIWRYPNVERLILCLYLGGMMTAIAIDLSFNGDAILVGMAILGFTAAFLYLLYFRPFLALTKDSLIVVNPVGSPREIPLASVAALEPGWAGLRITVRGDGVVRAWATQQWNLARWLRRRSRVDGICDAIRAQIAA